MSSEHVHPFGVRHFDLGLADGDHAFCEVVVVFHEQADGHHDKVNVVEDEGCLGGVVLAGLQEGDGVVAPVAEGVEVVRGVVAVVEAVAVGLGVLVFAWDMGK